MELPTIPKKLKEWKPEILNELIKYLDIESETFDFKKEVNDLETHISAMANTTGGFLILGIEEVKSEDSSRIIEFRKTGFDMGKQDFIKRSIGNSIFNIEPNPSVEIKHLEENGKFFTVVKIENEILKKPFMVKNKGQFFVRIGNSSRPASRITVLQLYSDGFDRIKSVERLHASTKLFKESFLHTVDDLQNATADWQQKVGVLDLTLIKNAIISAQWFLEENNLLGKKINQGYEMGFNDRLYKLERLNAYIRFYNDQSEPEPKKQMKNQFYEWASGHYNNTDMIEFLDTVMKTASDFLRKFK